MFWIPAAVAPVSIREKTGSFTPATLSTLLSTLTSAVVHASMTFDLQERRLWLAMHVRTGVLTDLKSPAAYSAWVIEKNAAPASLAMSIFVCENDA
jgi:hypothetical protein